MTSVCMSVNLVGAFKSLSLSSLSSSSSSFVGGDCRPIYVSAKTKLSVSFPNKFPLTIEAAHKKGAGSTKNGRDSKGRRLGVKIFGDQLAKPGAIIIRQRGTKVHPGNNVGIGRDHTIFSLIDGFVKFEKHGLDKKKVSVYPREVPPMNPNSYRARKIEGFRLQRERRKARKEAIANLKLEARANFKQEARANFKPQLILASADVPADETTNC